MRIGIRPNHALQPTPWNALAESAANTTSPYVRTIVVVRDQPENIVKRAIFYDIDSRPIHKVLTEKERGLYVREIRKDIAYFERTYRRVHITVDIAGLTPR